MTGVSQTFGLATAIAELGEANMLKYGGDFMLDMPGHYKEIVGKSIMMKDCIQYMNRDAAAILRDMQGVTGMAKFNQESFKVMLAGDYIVSLPVWWTAYKMAELRIKSTQAEEAGFTNEQDAIDYADRVVFRTQQSGLIMDLAAVESKNEFAKVFSIMYSAYSAMLQILVEHIGKYKLGKISAARLAADIIWISVVPGVLSQLLFGDDDDDDFEGIMRSVVSHNFGFAVGLRELSFYAKTGRMGDTPLASMIMAGPDLVEQIGQGELDSGAIRAAGRFGSIVLHISGLAGQGNRMAQYALAMEEGEIDSFNPYHALVTGPPRGAKQSDGREGRERREPRSGRERESRELREPRERR